MERYVKSNICDEIANKYNLIRISDTEWEVPETGVRIKQTIDGVGEEDYRIYYSNGDYITYASNFRLATIRAKSIL